MAPRAARLALLATAASLVVAGVVVIVPSPALATATWTTEAVAGPASGVAKAYMAADGERIGLAYQLTANHKVGFTLRGVDGTWTSKTTDITGNATKLDLMAIYHISGSNWFVEAQDFISGSAIRLWRFDTTNDGTTWSVFFHSSFCANSGSVNQPALIGVVYQQATSASACGTPQPTVLLQMYYDWTLGYLGCTSCTTTPVPAPLAIDDAYSDPAHDYGTSVGLGWSSAGFSPDGKTFFTMRATGTNPLTFSITKFDNNNGFWQNPYTTVGGSTPNPTLTYTVSAAITDSNLYRLGATSTLVAFTAGYTPSTNAQIHYSIRPITSTSTFTKAALNCATGNTPTSGPDHMSLSGTGTYNQFAYTCSSETGFHVSFMNTAGSAGATFFNAYDDTTTTATVMSTAFTATKAFTAFTDTGSGGLLKVVWAIASQVAPTAAGSATTTHTFTAGEGTPWAFDVDPLSKIVVTRMASGSGYGTAAGDQVVESFDPLTLNQRGSFFDTKCPAASAGVRVGLFAYHDRSNDKQFVAASNCSSGTDTCSSYTCVTGVSIRGGDLAQPDLSGSLCAGKSMCCDDPNATPPCDVTVTSTDTKANACSSTAGGSQVAGGTQNIADLEPYPITFTSNYGLGPQVGFAYSDYGSGYVGLFVHFFPGAACQYWVPFTSGGSVLQMCGWRSEIEADKSDYVAAASIASSTGFWRITGKAIDGTLTMASLGGFDAPYDTAASIACTKNVVAQMRSDGSVSVERIGTTGHGQHLLGGNYYVGTPGAFDRTHHAIAISADGNVTAYLNGTTVTLANATRFAPVYGSVSLPSGTFLDMRLSDTGKVLWVLTTTKLARYNLATIPSVSLPNTACQDGFRCIGGQAYQVTNGGDKVTSGTGTTTGGSGGTVTATTVAQIFTTPCSDLFGESGPWLCGLAIIAVCTGVGLVLLIQNRKHRGSVAFVLVGAVFGDALAVMAVNFPIWPTIVAIAGAVCIVLYSRRQ